MYKDIKYFYYIFKQKGKKKDKGKNKKKKFFLFQKLVKIFGIEVEIFLIIKSKVFCCQLS